MRLASRGAGVDGDPAVQRPAPPRSRVSSHWMAAEPRPASVPGDTGPRAGCGSERYGKEGTLPRKSPAFVGLGRGVRSRAA